MYVRFLYVAATSVVKANIAFGITVIFSVLFEFKFVGQFACSSVQNNVMPEMGQR